MSAWVAVDKNGTEFVYKELPIRGASKLVWVADWTTMLRLPKGSIEKLIGCTLTWVDDPVELK